jgi:hypothetical protein
VYDQGLSADMIFIEVANIGSVPVMVQSPWIMLPDKNKIVFPTPESEHSFPHELQPGHSTRIWTPSMNLKKVLIQQGYSGELKWRAVVNDTTGKITKSRKRARINLRG